MPAFSQLTWLNCVNYCHLLTLFGINMLFIKYVVDIVSHFRSEEKCFIKICLCSGNRHHKATEHTYTVTNASRCMWTFNRHRAKSNTVQLFLKTRLPFSSKGNVCNIFRTCVPRFCLCSSHVESAEIRFVFRTVFLF